MSVTVNGCSPGNDNDHWLRIGRRGRIELLSYNVGIDNKTIIIVMMTVLILTANSVIMQ